MLVSSLEFLSLFFYFHSPPEVGYTIFTRILLVAAVECDSVICGLLLLCDDDEIPSQRISRYVEDGDEERRTCPIPISLVHSSLREPFLPLSFRLLLSSLLVFFSRFCALSIELVLVYIFYAASNPTVIQFSMHTLESRQHNFQFSSLSSLSTSFSLVNFTQHDRSM